MKNRYSNCRFVIVLLFLLTILTNSLAFASNMLYPYAHSDNSTFEKSILAKDFFPENDSKGTIPFEIPDDNEENSINDIEDTEKIDVVKPSISSFSNLSLNYNDNPSSHIYLMPLSHYHDILSPPPN